MVLVGEMGKGGDDDVKVGIIAISAAMNASFGKQNEQKHSKLLEETGGYCPRCLIEMHDLTGRLSFL